MDAERGPFRTAEPTEEARAEREREASFERVRVGTDEALATVRAKEKRLDALAWAFFGASVLGLCAVGIAFAQSEGVGGPLACPAVALVIVAVLTLVHRRRLGRGA